MIAAASNGALDSLQSVVGLSVGGLMMLVVGRQMIRLWDAWQKYAEVASKRSHEDESRADTLQRELTQVQSNLAEVRVHLAEEKMRNEYLTKDNLRLQKIIGEVAGDPEPATD